MSLSLVISPQDVATLDAQLTVISRQVDVLASTTTLPDVTGPQDLGSMTAKINTLSRRINALGTPPIPLIVGPQSVASMNAQLNAMRRAINAMTFGGGAYTGPLDIVSEAVVAYSHRALSAAKRGTALYTIREDAGNTTQSFNSDAVTGAAPSGAILAFLAGANGFGTIWNDQSGNSRDGVQATAINQMAWLPAALNGVPAFSGDLQANFPIGQFFATASAVSLTTDEFTAFSVVRQRAGGAWFGMNGEGGQAPHGSALYLESGNPGTGISQVFNAAAESQDGSSGNGANYAGDSDAATYYLYDAAWGPTSNSGLQNGIVLTVSNNDQYGGGLIGTINYPIAVGSDEGSSNFSITGEILEVILYASILSDPNRLAIRQNIAAYYGITL